MRKAVAGLLLGIIVVLFIAMSASYAAIPRLVTVEGKLRNSTTNAPLTGVYNITLGVWTASVSGTQLFVENLTTTTDSFGVFQVIMGSVKLLDTTFPSPSYLEVTVNGTTLSPRHTLTSSPTTFRANTSNYAEDLSCTGCIGTVDIAADAVEFEKYDCVYLAANCGAFGATLSVDIRYICDDADGCTIRWAPSGGFVVSHPAGYAYFAQESGYWSALIMMGNGTYWAKTGQNGEGTYTSIINYPAGSVCQLQDDSAYEQTTGNFSYYCPPGTTTCNWWFCD